MPLDPQVAAYYRRQAPMTANAESLSLEALRENADRKYHDRRKFPPVFSVADMAVPGPAGGIPLRVYRPEAGGALPVLLFFHGGGFVMHNIASHDSLCRRLCNVCGCAVFNVGYRLAPEFPYPAALEDAYTALQWIHGNAEALEVDAARIALAGDSAGATISAALSLLARDRRGPGIALQVLCYGPAGCRGSGETASMQAFSGGGYVLTREFLALSQTLYTPGITDLSDPYLNPGQAPDLSGLPRTYLVTAEYDPLRDDGELFAQRLREAGNDVTQYRAAGLMHGFLLLWEEFDRANAVIDRIGRQVRDAFA